jgi:DNA end-binding protein Ku
MVATAVTAGRRTADSTLAYADEVVPVVEVEGLDGLDRVEVVDCEVRMAEMLVESLIAEFEPEKYQDQYRRGARAQPTHGRR